MSGQGETSPSEPTGHGCAFLPSSQDPLCSPLGSLSIRSPHSKQRHNKLWRQQTDGHLQQPADDTAESSDCLPETVDGALDTQLPCLDDTTQPGLPGSQAPGGSSLPCCFRRLSDPLLFPQQDDSSVLVHVEDLERDALLEEVAQPMEVHKSAQHPQQGAELCEKDVKKKLELGSLNAHSGSLPQVEEMEREEGPRAGRWGRASTQRDRSLLDQENLNNNNSKRSCPDDFEVGIGSVWRGKTLH